MINLIQLEHFFWSLSVLKELQQVSHISISMPPMVREFITCDTSVIILVNISHSFAHGANFCHFFFVKIVLFTIRHSRGRVFPRAIPQKGNVNKQVCSLLS